MIDKINLENIYSGDEKIQEFGPSILDTYTQGEVSKYCLGDRAELMLLGLYVSIVDLELVVRTEAGFGIKDDALCVKVGRIGIGIGRRMGYLF